MSTSLSLPWLWFHNPTCSWNSILTIHAKWHKTDCWKLLFLPADESLTNINHANSTWWRNKTLKEDWIRFLSSEKSYYLVSVDYYTNNKLIRCQQQLQWNSLNVEETIFTFWNSFSYCLRWRTPIYVIWIQEIHHWMGNTTHYILTKPSESQRKGGISCKNHPKHDY